MPIVLIDHIWPAKLVKSGRVELLALIADQHLIIETSPQGEEVLDATCPAGKMWSARIIVEITETDAA